MQSLQKLFTIDEFIDFLQEQPENICYELYDGDIIQMPLPTGEHEEVVGFLIKILLGECLRLNLNSVVPNKTLVKPETKQWGRTQSNLQYYAIQFQQNFSPQQRIFSATLQYPYPNSRINNYHQQ